MQRKRVGEGWPGAAAQLLLRSSFGADVNDPMFSEPLAECAFQEYPIDTWQKVCLPPPLAPRPPPPAVPPMRPASTVTMSLLLRMEMLRPSLPPSYASMHE